MANRLTNFKSDGTPIKSTEKHKVKREKLKSRRGDKVRNISVNLKDVDKAHKKGATTNIVHKTTKEYFKKV